MQETPPQLNKQKHTIRVKTIENQFYSLFSSLAQFIKEDESETFRVKA